MTKQDYELIADSLKRSLGHCETQNQRRGVERAARELSWALTDTNPRFDRIRFVAACGVA